MGFMCPVCGYPNLDDSPHTEYGGASYEICPSCWFQFGYDDDDQGISYTQWRSDWIAQGMLWRGKGIAPPPDWDPVQQLRAVTDKGDPEQS